MGCHAFQVEKCLKHIHETHEPHILTFSTNEHANLDGKHRVDFVKELHAKKLKPRGDGHFQMLERINDNAYKLDLPTTYMVFDSRINSFEEGRNDRDRPNKAKDPLHDIGVHMTRSETKMMKQSLQGLIVEIKESSEQNSPKQKIPSISGNVARERMGKRKHEPMCYTYDPCAQERLHLENWIPSNIEAYLGKCVVVYFDDILIYSACLNDHLLHVTSVRQILRKEILFANLEKYIFCTNEVGFRGFVVSSHGVKVDSEKVNTI
ncbi:Retrovirus-related Pol polyprotein from transposon opus, partial [Mucuna pruriens]